MFKRRRYRPNVARRKVVACPYCQKALSTLDMAIRAHLRTHIKDGQLNEKDLLMTVDKLKD
jgi:glutaredoxin